VVTISNELGDPRYPTAANKIKARRKKPTIVSVEDLGLSPEELQPRVTFTRQFVPTVQGNCEFISGETAATTADSLIARLREESVI
jgi:electron transfer flavoprotein beta subunit